MATTFKTFLNNDIATTRTLLHEAIPVTGTIVSGTYLSNNIKNYAHGMFQSVYDYPYLSSSANQVYDCTIGYSAQSSFSSSASTQNAKKINIYNQMAQVLVGHDVTGNIDRFDTNGDKTEGRKMHECFFLNFARLLTKDEIKKGSFTVQIATGTLGRAIGANSLTGGTAQSQPLTLGDYGAATSFKSNSPTGEYGLLMTSSTSDTAFTVGHVYYQAGIAVITASVFTHQVTGAIGTVAGSRATNPNTDFAWHAQFGNADSASNSVDAVFTGSTIQHASDGFSEKLMDISFNNTTELNSTIYFCRANHNDFNYSANPTYLSASKIRVKGDNPFAEPSAYITSVGLYSSDNELLAVAKLSEPLKKTPSNELTIRTRLDY